MSRMLSSALALIVLASVTHVNTQAQSVSQRTRVVYGYPAGDAADTMIRFISEYMAKEMKRTFIVENMGGASGRIGLKAIISSSGDGSNLLFTPMAPVTIFPSAMPNLGYDPFKDIKPVTQIATFDIALGVGAQVPVNSLQELVTWAKANPSSASYGVPGAGGLPNYFATMFANSAGIKVEKIPYRGTAPAINDMIAGHLPFMLTTTGQLMEQYRQGKLRIIATSGERRSPFTPEVPTFREGGYDLVGEGWFAVFAPASMSDELVEHFSSAFRRVLAQEDVRSRIMSWAFVPKGTTPQQLREIQHVDNKRWEPAIRESGFVLQ